MGTPVEVSHIAGCLAFVVAYGGIGAQGEQGFHGFLGAAFVSESVVQRGGAFVIANVDVETGSDEGADGGIEMGEAVAEDDLYGFVEGGAASEPAGVEVGSGGEERLDHGGVHVARRAMVQERCEAMRCTGFDVGAGFHQGEHGFVETVIYRVMKDCLQVGSRVDGATSCDERLHRLS